MKKTSFYSSLIQAIEDFYLMITLAILHKRIEVHQEQGNQSLKHYANDIKRPLRECINRIAVIEPGNTTESLPLHASASANTADQHIPGQYNISELHVINQKNVDALSKHFKASNNESISNIGVGKRLEHSTWEHVHASIRHARKGDKRNAKSTRILPAPPARNYRNLWKRSITPSSLSGLSGIWRF